MAAVFPLELDELESVVRRAQAHGMLEIGGYNSPTQHVLSGERPAVAAALRILEEEYLVEGVVIEPRIPMHSTRFWPVVRAFLPALRQASWQPVSRPYLPNAAGRFIWSPTPGDLIDALALHVWRPVRWRRSIDLLVRLHPDAIFVEVGPRAVLCGLLQRRWHARPKLHTDGTSAEAIVRALVAAGREPATDRLAA
jgi:[acyl-carrier-protein] S-malonyltransferase